MKYWSVFTIVLLAFSIAFSSFEVEKWLEGIVHWINSLGSIAPVVFIVIFILSCVLLLPGGLLTASAGLLFGLQKGILYVSISVTIGALLSFLIGRYFLRSWVVKKSKQSFFLQNLDQAVSVNGWRMVVLARLCPLVPFRISNYIFGVTDISLKQYFLATWLATLPSSALYVSIGAFSLSLLDLATDIDGISNQQWAFLIFSSLLSILFLMYVARTIKRAYLRALIENDTLSNSEFLCL